MILYKISTSEQARRLFLSLCIVSAMLQLLAATPLPQNVFENVAAEALTLAGKAAEVFEQGAAIRKEHGFESPILAVHSKAEAGMDNAMRRRSDFGEQDSDEERRRKRQVEFHDNLLAGTAAHSHLHRGKRSPCHTKQTTPTDEAVDVDVDVAERRRRKAAQRKRSTQKARSKTKKVTDLSRRRREADSELDDVEGEFANAGSQFSEHAKRFAEKVQGIWESLKERMKSMVQQVQKSIAGAKAEEEP